MKNRINSLIESLSISLMLLTLFAALWGMTVYAADTGTAGSESDLAAKKIGCVLCNVAQIIFMVVGALASLVIILAGLKWLTSGDDPGARNAAKTAIISVFVGIIIIFIAVYIVAMVMKGMNPMFSKLDIYSWLTAGGCDPLCSATLGTTTPP